MEDLLSELKLRCGVSGKAITVLFELLVVAILFGPLGTTEAGSCPNPARGLGSLVLESRPLVGVL